MELELSGRSRIKVDQIFAEGVLGEYNHSLKFEADSNFVIVYGPNGVGKTKFLEIIDGLASLNVHQLRLIPFVSASIHYDDGSVLAVQRTGFDLSDLGSSPGVMRFLVFSGPSADPLEWVVDTADSASFEQFLSLEMGWVQIGPSTWQDPSDGEIAEIAELNRRYGRGRTAEVPNAEMMNFVSSRQTHLIETQRLRTEQYLDQLSMRSRDFPSAKSTITEFAEQMKSRLRHVLAENSRVTQQLDRTFPRRMLEHRPPIWTTEEEIRHRYQTQEAFRRQLAQIALTELQPEIALPDRRLEPHEISMLDLYLKDTDEKLSSFEVLLGKIRLLEDAVNRRILQKELHVNANDGLAVARARTGELLDLDALSSGEQHEIILMFRLLFNVSPGSLVLIDEPEISLHISWQLNFMDDVNRIADNANFQFVVATHSPQIINTWWSNTVQLGPDFGELT